jgi:hypothetical protein
MGGGGVDGFRWRLGVGLRIDGGVGLFIMVALSGSFSSLEHGGHQMLGLNSRGISSPEHEGGCEGPGEYNNNKCRQ